MKNGKTIVIGVIGSDCHAVGNKIIDHVLTQDGFNVINVGVISPQEDFINAAVETDADAIIISSLYGHGELDCQGFKDKCNEAGLQDVKLYVGGNIVVGKQVWENVNKRFLDMGFDRVYRPGTPIEETIKDIKKDLGMTLDMIKEDDAL